MTRMAPALSVGMSQALEIAERQGGKAIAAWIEAKDGEPGYAVKIVESGRVREPWVNGA
jgi:hypothetical protein